MALNIQHPLQRWLELIQPSYPPAAASFQQQHASFWVKPPTLPACCAQPKPLPPPLSFHYLVSSGARAAAGICASRVHRGRRHRLAARLRVSG